MFFKKSHCFSKTLEKVLKSLNDILLSNLSSNFYIHFLAKFVSVGWGSKETQFHGSEGKDARSKKEIQSTLADWDDRMTRITWRADGLFFAINTVEPNQGMLHNFFY